MNSRLVLGLCLGLLALPPARGDDEAQIKAVLDKAFQAHGGKDKLVRLKSHACTMQGKVQHSGQEVQFKGRWQTQAPDRLRIDVHVPFMGIEFKYAQVFHGAQSWNALNDNVLDLSKPARAEGLEQAWAYNLARLTPLVEPGVRLHYLGASTVDKEAALGLAVRRAERRAVKLFFAQKTGLLLKTATRSRDLFDLEQEFLLETYYSDYRKVDGVPVAHKVRMQRDGKPYMEMECKEHKLADALADEVFARP